MTASARRVAVHEAMTAANVSERRACRFVGVPRATQRYHTMRDDRRLRDRLETLAMLKPRWGYRRLHWLLVREGWPVNRKRVQRVYRDAGLTVRRRRRKRVSMARVPRPVVMAPNERWSMDFVHDTLGDGRVRGDRGDRWDQPPSGAHQTPRGASSRLRSTGGVASLRSR